MNFRSSEWNDANWPKSGTAAFELEIMESSRSINSFRPPISDHSIDQYEV